MVLRMAVVCSRAVTKAKFILAACSLMTFGALGFASPALALDGTESASTAPLQMFKDPLEALQKYREQYRLGNSASSLSALRYAADGGEPLAEWKLGTMYRSGDGVPQDDLKAFNYFSRIVDDYDEDRSDWRETPVVSSAFVAVGVYSLNGIAEAKMPADSNRALQMFHYAATNFGDPNAQYNLARMYLDGSGVARDPQQAARWLNLAADKGLKEAEALLGNLLFRGDGAVQPQRALGLMYLTLAREAAIDPKKDSWIVNLHDNALQSSTDDEKGMARHYLENYVRRAAAGVTAER